MFRTSIAAVAVLASTPLLAQSTPQPLPRAQFQATMAAEFKEVDADKDGHLTRAEVETSQKAAIESRIRARNAALFARLDADKSGQISAAEFAALPVTAPRADATAFLRLDTDKDGKVSAAEHAAGTTANFNRMDSNKDGVISLTEAKVESTKGR